MTKELEEILEYLIDTDKYIEEFGYQYKRLSLHDTCQLLNYITNLQQENEKLKYNARGQVNDYFKDKYSDVILKNVDLIKDYELTCYKNYELKQENDNLKNFITNLISELKHCELNGTKKLDIVSDYIEQEYEKVLSGSDENERRKSDNN